MDVIESMMLDDQEDVDKFLPKYRKSKNTLHPDKPSTWGTIGLPEIQTELKKQHEDAIINSKNVIKEVWKDFLNIFNTKVVIN